MQRSVFISSCSRRQLSRRRPARHAMRLQLLITLLVLASALGVILVGRGWI